VGDFKQFKNGAQFGAWIGLVPRQHSSGGKNNLGGLTKRGDTYLRSLFIQGAKSAVMSAHKRSDPISQWVAALRDKGGSPCKGLGGNSRLPIAGFPSEWRNCDNKDVIWKGEVHK
jgi:transposase